MFEIRFLMSLALLLLLPDSFMLFLFLSFFLRDLSTWMGRRLGHSMMVCVNLRFPVGLADVLSPPYRCVEGLSHWSYVIHTCSLSTVLNPPLICMLCGLLTSPVLLFNFLSFQFLFHVLVRLAIGFTRRLKKRLGCGTVVHVNVWYFCLWKQGEITGITLCFVVVLWHGWVLIGVMLSWQHYNS